MTDLPLNFSNLTVDSLLKAERVAFLTGEGLGVALTRLGSISEADLASAFARHFEIALLGMPDLAEVQSLPERLPLPYLRQARALPVAIGDAAITLAMADPSGSHLTEESV